jgi:hypothetical protein
MILATEVGARFVWKEDGAYDVEIVDYHRERKGKK